MTEEESLMTLQPPIFCSLCGDEIDDDDAEPEVIIGDYNERYTYWFHQDCYKEVRPSKDEW